MQTICIFALVLLLLVFDCNGQLGIGESNKDKLKQEIQKSFHEGYQAALKEGFHKKDNEKRYDIATLNQAARSRNTLLSSYGGDPYGMGSTMLSKQQVTYGRKKRHTETARRDKRYVASPESALREAYNSGYAAGKEVLAKMQKESQEKRYSVERLNQAARHRNVYFDAVGGDPYGGSSVVASRQHVHWNHGKRSIKPKDEKMNETKAVRRLLRRVLKISKKRKIAV